MPYWPKEGGSRQRGDAMSGPAVSAWKAGGSQWKAWSSRLFMATLKTGKRKSGRLHVLSCYAPTFATSREEKDKFFDLLQDQPFHQGKVMSCLVTLTHVWGPGLWMTMNGELK